MKIEKILLVSLCAFFVGACTVKDFSPKDFENYSAKQILKGGERALAKKDYTEAVKYFESIDALYPFDPEAQQGQLDIIYAYYKAEDYPSALVAANRYIHLYPEGSYTDYAYYMKGMANFHKDRTLLQKVYPLNPEKIDISNLQSAFIAFGDLISKFPHSKYGKDAERRMVYIRNLLAGHELYVADFYYKRKAYVAAANRAGNIVKNFKGVFQVREALIIMYKSYRALNLNKQANDTLRTFQLNFPGQSIY